MPDSLNRRALLQAAGGVTFLALAPAERGFALPPSNSGARQPLFTALPYLQPGPGDDASLALCWQTDDLTAEFQVTVSGVGTFAPTRSELWSGDLEDGEARLHYAAHVTGLSMGKRYAYRVSMGSVTILEGYFTTKKPRGAKTRFVAFGDNSYGDLSDRMIAHQAYLARPDFVMNTGDNVYDSGTVGEYERHFFPVYNADAAGPRLGAPLLRSVPFFTVLANHDVHDKDEKKHPVADFTKNPDSLAYFTNLRLPQNGYPGATPPPTMGDEKLQTVFRQAAGERYPRQTTYRYDWGDCHFLCLDSNLYVDPTDSDYRSWVEEDLKGSSAPWKFVVFHHPPFNVGEEHYAEQHMRVLSPIFERHGVTMVLSGHEHNYQRTVPLKFAPGDLKGARNVGTKARKVPGTFALDKTFDGVKNTRPDGVIYVVTGAGGKHLYDSEWQQTPRTHPEDGDVAYVARFVSDRHSLTVFDVTSKTLTMTQIDQWGGVLDRVKLTK